MPDRCTYCVAGLRCVRDDHPHDPGAHVRESTWVPDHHDVTEDAA